MGATNALPRQPRGFIESLVIGALLLALVVVGAIWLLINARDESLNPRVRAVLDAKHDYISADNNLFFAILAFDSQADGDIGQQGRELYASYLAALHANPQVAFDFKSGATFTRESFVGNKDVLCARSGRVEDCIERVIAHPEEFQKLVTENHLLLNRYQAVSTYTRLENPIDLTFATPVAPWAPFMLGKRLFLTNVALDIRLGRIDAGIERLRSDLAFTRQILAEPDIILIDKFILAASERASLGFISDLLRTRTLSDAQYAELNAIVTPLTASERSLAIAFSREFTAFAAEIRELTEPKSPSPIASYISRWQDLTLPATNR
jgi:hypothetical protein